MGTTTRFEKEAQVIVRQGKKRPGNILPSETNQTDGSKHTDPTLYSSSTQPYLRYMRLTLITSIFFPQTR